MMILLALMAVLLPVLAGLQYYWLGEVSKGATERLQSTLATGAQRFRQDFNREFIRAYLNFQIDPASPPADLDQYQVQMFERWNSSAPYAQLVREVFVVTENDRGVAHARRVNLQTKRLESVDSTPEGQTLQRLFERSSVDSFDEDLPALIVPIPNLRAKDSDTPAATRAFTVVALNFDYLIQEFVPVLIQRQFSENFNDYNFGLISVRRPEHIIYSSANSPTDFSSGDAATRVFGIEPEELQAFVRSEASPVGTPRLRLNLRLLKSPGEATSSNTEGGRWQFVIKHRSGSLAAAVNSVRRRNLALSFAILLLLATAFALTAISMRRAARLAEQQMNFVAGVTHELRTPLTVICSAGENLADGVVSDSARVADYGRTIHREGRRLADMVEQVLGFAGAHSGQRRYQFEPVRVENLIADALNACDAQIRQEAVEVETSIERNLPDINGDPVALKQAIQNLISNAIKYGGAARWMRISAQQSNDAVVITVEDRGIGINKAEVKHIFNPFYRGREAIAGQFAGTGVGLSLVKQIVAAHSGTIEVKSSTDAGTVFTLQLPFARESKDVRGLVEFIPPAN